jgi:N-acetylneuraminate synthase
MFGVQVGLSDHTLGIGVALASVSLGATVIEKHLTIRRADGGVDSAFSLEPEEMRALVAESERAWKALGTVSYGPTEKEKASMQYRRSLYVVEDMKSGDLFTAKNVRAIRPGLGLPPKYFQIVVGKRTSKDVRKGTPLGWDLIA